MSDTQAVAAVVQSWVAAPGASFTDEQASVYGPALADLEKRYAGLPITVVLHAARDENSPLHDYFEWNDEVAGTHWRRQQARNLLNHLRVVIHTEKGNRETKAFFNVRLAEPHAEGRQYVNVEKALGNEVYRNQIVAQALKEAKAWRTRYQEYKELRPITRAISRVERAIKA